VGRQASPDGVLGLPHQLKQIKEKGGCQVTEYTNIRMESVDPLQ
jgi:hypothetical protein